MFNDKILVYRRDNNPEILYPGLLDLPGGGRENDETPEKTVLRELQEEFGLYFTDDRLLYKQQYFIPDRNQIGFFFAAEITQKEIHSIEFGEEGVAWEMMPVSNFVLHTDAIEHLQKLVQGYFNSPT